MGWVGTYSEAIAAVWLKPKPSAAYPRRRKPLPLWVTMRDGFSLDAPRIVY